MSENTGQVVLLLPSLCVLIVKCKQEHRKTNSRLWLCHLRRQHLRSLGLANLSSQRRTRLPYRKHYQYSIRWYRSVFVVCAEGVLQISECQKCESLGTTR